MTTTALVRSILGFTRCNIKPLVYSIDIAYDLIFVQGKERSSLRVTKDVYVDAAKHFPKIDHKSVVRQIQRSCHRCWNQIRKNKSLRNKFIGNRSLEIESPSEIIFILACYKKYGKPFLEVLDDEPALTF